MIRVGVARSARVPAVPGRREPVAGEPGRGERFDPEFVAMMRIVLVTGVLVALLWVLGRLF